MIRVTGELNDGQKFLLLGVDRTNIDRLTGGNPIICRGESVGIDRDVIIVFGETLDDVDAGLTRLGIVKPVAQ